MVSDARIRNRGDELPKWITSKWHSICLLRELCFFKSSLDACFFFRFHLLFSTLVCVSANEHAQTCIKTKTLRFFVKYIYISIVHFLNTHRRTHACSCDSLPELWIFACDEIKELEHSVQLRQIKQQQQSQAVANQTGQDTRHDETDRIWLKRDSNANNSDFRLTCYAWDFVFVGSFSFICLFVCLNICLFLFLGLFIFMVKYNLTAWVVIKFILFV